jgi:hypothetical protein
MDDKDLEAATRIREFAEEDAFSLRDYATWPANKPYRKDILRRAERLEQIAATVDQIDPAVLTEFVKAHKTLDAATAERNEKFAHLLGISGDLAYDLHHRLQQEEKGATANEYCRLYIAASRATANEYERMFSGPISSDVMSSEASPSTLSNSDKFNHGYGVTCAQRAEAEDHCARQWRMKTMENWMKDRIKYIIQNNLTYEHHLFSVGLAANAEELREKAEMLEALSQSVINQDEIDKLVSGGDDRVRIGAPDKGCCLGLVVLGDEAVDGGLQIGDGAEDAKFQPPTRELGKEAFDGVQPGA